MSWLRGSPFPFGRQASRSLDPRTDYEPTACFQTFCKHWQQAVHIINTSQSTQSSQQDAVLGVVSHVEQTATLLALEGRACDLRAAPAPHPTSPPACLQHLLAENLLQFLYDWSLNTGRYMNAVRVEQLKLYSVLVSCYGDRALAADAVLRPLLRLLHACCGELLPQPVEGEVVALLGQLCVVLMQNLPLVDLFFLPAFAHPQSQPHSTHQEFVPVRLLLGSVHGEGAAGAGARDALLLCANMSARHERLAAYLLERSDACVLLATGLSGLYSLLPRTLTSAHLPARRSRLRPDHVAAVPRLSLFIDSIEFCDAVAQVAPSPIRRQLLDFFYQGFLVPVMGPALLQSGAAEQTAAVAYLELCVRCVCARGLLPSLLRFLLLYSYDDVRLLHVLLAPRRLHSDTQLALVSLALVETLVELNCEDVMLELVYRHLLAADPSPPQAPHHPSCRESVWECEAYRVGAAAFLSLAPECCARPHPPPPPPPSPPPPRARPVHRGDIALDMLLTDTALHYANPNESLMGDYNAYLCDARHAIETRALACGAWSCLRDLPTPSAVSPSAVSPSAVSPSAVSPSAAAAAQPAHNGDTGGKEQEHDSLTSLGESSGYESFRCRHDDHDDNEDTADDAFAEDSFWCEVEQAHRTHRVAHPPSHHPARLVSMSSHKMECGSGSGGGGPLLGVLLERASRLLQCELHVAVLVTGLLSKLAAFPAPPLTRLLLCPSLPTVAGGTPSLYQVLSEVKREADEVTHTCSDTPALVDRARSYLVRRELAHSHRRRPAPPAPTPITTVATPSSEWITEENSRGIGGGESKRRSLSSSLSHMLVRRLAHITSPPATPQPAIPRPQHVDSSEESEGTEGGFWSRSASRRAVLNAVLLDEWLRELSALAHEHALHRAARAHPSSSLGL